jgi:phosphatidylserine decarboxylase
MRIPISKECTPYALITFALTVLVALLNLWLALIPGLMFIFVLFFFRNPERKIPESDEIILSPADGKIMEIKEIYDDSFSNGHAIKVSIFLSLVNVHVNRSPISGEIAYTNYRPGKFFPAFKSHASDLNERNTIGIEHNDLKILVHQITGFVARRIVCWVKESDHVEKGERFGLIKFGSCTEIVMPADVKITAKVGQVVKGGRTVIGRLMDE